ncbi:glycosyltransferase family 2 protein [Scytonema sp. NUACC26]|uniref:glycosyltransferase family 2 protein n=1 Tax=Scytonema sp. NUACC26 TaxID=3140176 RepID=UPI0034DCBA1C
MSEPQVTIVVVPRERFSYTSQSLGSIYENTHFPFKLVYVDGNSPAHIKQYLKKQAEQKGFQLLRYENYLTPNRSRNIGLSCVNTKYVVFIDNDVLVKPGWLEALVQCAEETGAWVVGPLCLEGQDFKTVHMVGGTSIFKEKGNRRWLVEKRPFMKLPLEKVASQLQRQATEILELHCIFARTETFDMLGKLDENLMSMGEESDFCMTVINAGKLIYVEPDSVISYVPPPPLVWSDLPFYFVRWSGAWCKKSVNHFKIKWNLTEDSPTLKHYEEFVEKHRYLAYQASQKNLKYFVKRTFLALLYKVMNWRASTIL